MRISRLAIRNFRNFRQLDIETGEHVVIVGENGVGKSNLVHALRLVLDHSLPESMRTLRDEDFWDGLPRPLATDEEVRIAVEVTDFENNDAQLACLAEFLVNAEPMVARLTYVARPTSVEGTQASEFDFTIFGGGQEENAVAYDVRRRLPIECFHALRDVESDLSNWRRSPLRPMLERAWANVPMDDKEKLQAAIQDASAGISSVESITELAGDMNDMLLRVGGSQQVQDVDLGVAPADIDRLLRTVRLLFDGGRRTVTDTSLGLANVLYFTLKVLAVRQLGVEGTRDHTFLTIEEPEAHLHPHLQRQVFRTFLRLRPHLPGPEDQEDPGGTPATVLLTTHSPNIASVAPLKNLVLLRRRASAGPVRNIETVAASTASLELDAPAVEDLERYIDASRGELLFAKGVLLCEGEAEVYLLPQLAVLQNFHLDSHGVSVCPVWGTHFESFVVFLKALEIPYAVITDGDPEVKEASTGIARGQRLLQVTEPSTSTPDDDDDIRPACAGAGIFIGDHTLEVDLLGSGHREVLAEVLRELAPTGAASTRAKKWGGAKGVVDDTDRLLKDIANIGKGRFAQRLAAKIGKTQQPGTVPPYIANALEFLRSRVGA